MNIKKIVKEKRIVLIVGTTIAIILTLAGCGKKDDNETITYNKENDIAIQNVTKPGNTINTINDVNQNENNVNKQTQSNPSTSLIKDDSKKIVYEIVNDAKEWSYISEYNGREIKEAYSYRIPQINIASTDADNINQKIQNEYVKVYNEYKENVNKYGHVGACSKIEYAYHFNGEVLSIVMASFWDGGSVQRSAYNISTKTGKEITNSELLSKKGISESDFPSKLSNILTNVMKSFYSPGSEMLDLVEYYSNRYKSTTSLENCSANNDMYLNSNNQLCVIVSRYNLAGPGTTEIIVNMETNDIYVQE